MGGFPLHPSRCARLSIGALLAAGVALLGLLAYQPSMLVPLPTAATIRSRALAPSGVILDRNGHNLYEMIDPHAGLHRPLDLGDISLHLQRAIIATEDASFYDNPGMNLRAIVRALVTNLRSGEIVSGGSTITQQLARNLLLTEEERYQKTWQRKLRETFLAYHMTRTLGKQEILALYLNETYFGNMAYGVEAAARSYFGKSAAELDLAESALLAGLPQSPANYNPLTDLQAAKTRQKVVLDLMVRAGYISAGDAALAWREPLHFASALIAIEAPHACMLIRSELEQVLGAEVVRAGGLRVHTTLDVNLQRATLAHVRRHLAELNRDSSGEPDHNVRNAAVVVLDPRDGAILAMVGSPDYFDREIDGAVNAALSLRQPGSAIKPLTYSAAFEQGYSPSTVVADVHSSFVTREGRPYVPINYDYRFHGPVSLREALASSYNVVAVKLLDEIGIEALPSMARRLGITSLDQSERHGLSLTLGSCEVQLLELTTAYAAFATGGWSVHPRLIDFVEDSEGHVIYKAQPEQRERLLDESVAYLITDILSDEEARVPAFGEGSMLDMPFPAAVKTGTTTDWRDNWTIGYTTEAVTGVWVGNADNEPMSRVSGVSGAAPIWNAVMRTVHSQPPQPLRRPEGLVDIDVCAESGLLPGIACRHRKRALFVAENAPTDRCPMHRLLTFDAATGEPALPDSPSDRRVLRRVTFWPPEALAWAQEEGLPLPPADFGAEVFDPSPAPGEERSPAAQAEGEPDSHGVYLSSPAPNGNYVIAPSIPLRFQSLEVVAACLPRLDLREAALWVDDRMWHTWSSPPYRVLWPLSPGVHEFRVEGLDSDLGSVVSPPLRITVSSARDDERTSP